MRMEDGSIFLQEVTEKIKERIAQTEETLAAGQKEIENMHDYYWENYTEMDQYGYEDFDNRQALLQQEMRIERQGFYIGGFSGCWNLLFWSGRFSV